jgi:hypothetical protein
MGGSGTTTSLPRFTAATTLGDSAVFDDGTNVYLTRAANSIGNIGVAPGNTLEVGSATAVGIRINSGASAKWDFDANYAVDNNLTLSPALGGGNFIISGTNVGIGTTSPGSKISVSDTQSLNSNGTYVSSSVSSTLSAGATISGEFSGHKVTSTNSGLTLNGNQNAIYGLAIHNSVNTTDVRGGYFESYSNSGVVTNLVGVYAKARSNGPSTNLYGSYNLGERIFSTASTVHGSYSEAKNTGGGLNIANAYGVLGERQMQMLHQI